MRFVESSTLLQRMCQPHWIGYTPAEPHKQGGEGRGLWGCVVRSHLYAGCGTLCSLNSGNSSPVDITCLTSCQLCWLPTWCVLANMHSEHVSNSPFRKSKQSSRRAQLPFSEVGHIPSQLCVYVCVYGPVPVCAFVFCAACRFVLANDVLDGFAAAGE